MISFIDINNENQNTYLDKINEIENLSSYTPWTAGIFIRDIYVSGLSGTRSIL